MTLLTIAAIAPAIFLLSKVYKADRIEKESKSVLIKLVLMGIVSTFFASITESLGEMILLDLFPEYSICYLIIFNYIVVALSEEGFKYLLLKKKTWESLEFNCQFDGIVYAVFVSLGFALWENIGYVFQFGFQTAIMRALTAVPGHACFGVFMGAFYGMAKRSYNFGYYNASKYYRYLSVIVPVFLHGTYDFAASVGSNMAILFFFIFIIVMFTLAYKLTKKLSSEDTYI